MSISPIDAFLRDYSKEVEEGNAAVFIGAGLSIPAGFVDWRKLLKTFAQDIGPLVATGKISGQYEHRFPGLKESVRALNAVHTGENTGKAVIVVDESGL